MSHADLFSLVPVAVALLGEFLATLLARKGLHIRVGPHMVDKICPLSELSNLAHEASEHYVLPPCVQVLSHLALHKADHRGVLNTEHF